MHSYTSNSNSRIPINPYRNIWALTLLLLLVALFVSERTWRDKGFLPNVTDTELYWGFKRDNVYAHNDKKIVIIGASRAQLGIVPGVVEDELNDYNVVHLAIDGSNSFPVLKDLCEDPGFTGIIVFSTTSIAIQHHQGWGIKPWIDAYYNNFDNYGAIEKKINLQIQGWLQTNLAIMSSQLNLKKILLSNFSPEPIFVHMQQDRYKPAYYYERMTLDELKEHRERKIKQVKRSYKPTTVEDEAAFQNVVENNLLTLYNKLKNRGGDLILIRMPTTDAHWQYDYMAYPKEKFWDQITKWSHVPTIHFKDYNLLKDFDCPETSHLDATDAPEFTKRLINIIKDKIGL